MGSNRGIKLLKSYEKEWAKLFRNLNFKEITWERKQGIEDFWTWSDGYSYSRIDRIYIKSDLNFKISYDEINNLTSFISDHKIIISTLDFGRINNNKKNKVKTRWKLNEEILIEKEVIEGIKKFCVQIPNLKKKYKSLWYDKFIGYVVNFLKIKSREVGQKKKEVKKIFSKLGEINRDRDGLTKEQIKEEMIYIEKQIDSYYENIRRGIEKKQRDKKFHSAKHPTKVLVEKINKNEKKSEINNYLCKNGTVVTETKHILHDVNEYYTDLLGTDKENKEELNAYSFKIKNVENIVKEYPINLNAPITYNEALEVINNMKESSPGENGLTIGIYKKYFDLQLKIK